MQPKSSAKCPKTRKSTRVQRTLLECGYNPRFSLDEDDLPSVLVPQVLLEGNFDELVDAVGQQGSVTPQAKTTEATPVVTIEDSKTPDVTEAVNVSIGGIPPGTSTPTSPTSIKSSCRKNKVKPKTPTGNSPGAAKGSPFTRYLFKKTEPNKDQGSSDTNSEP